MTGICWKDKRRPKKESEFSDKIHVVKTPELQISKGTDDKVSINVSNLSEYGAGSSYIGYAVYTYSTTGEEVLLGEATSVEDVIEIEVASGTKIYAKAIRTESDTETYYSDTSIQYTVE